MSFFDQPSTIVVSCYPHLSEYLAKEITDLGFQPMSVTATAVAVKGTLNDCMLLNLHIRTGSRILFQLRKFKCNSIDELYETVLSMPWEKYLDSDGYFSVTSSSNHPDVRNTMYLNMRVKDAVADRFVKNFGSRPDSGGKKEGFTIHVFWKNDEAVVSIDTSGNSISKHGYRIHPGKAPLQESLAAAMILATGWNASKPLYTPMCGSGTLAIEAALLAAKKAPGLLRDHFGFMSIKGYDNAVFESIRTKAENAVVDYNDPIIYASDISKEAVRLAVENADQAGVGHLIRFDCMELNDVIIEHPDGILIVNPPYGERLGEQEDLELLYKDLGAFFKKKCSGMSCFVLTSEKSLAAAIGLKTSAKIPFLNADIECRLLRYDMYSGSKKTKGPE